MTDLCIKRIVLQVEKARECFLESPPVCDRVLRPLVVGDLLEGVVGRRPVPARPLHGQGRPQVRHALGVGGRVGEGDGGQPDVPLGGRPAGVGEVGHPA